MQEICARTILIAESITKNISKYKSPNISSSVFVIPHFLKFTIFIIHFLLNFLHLSNDLRVSNLKI